MKLYLDSFIQRVQDLHPRVSLRKDGAFGLTSGVSQARKRGWNANVNVELPFMIMIMKMVTVALIIALITKIITTYN